MSLQPPIDDTFAYRQGFKNLVMVIHVQLIIIVVLAGFAYHYISNYNPQTRYFALTPDGSALQMESLEDPNLNNEALLAWVQQAVVDVLTFGFNDYNKRFEYSMRYFTPEGWVTFGTTLQTSRLMAEVVQYQQILTAIPRSPPQIIAWGYKNGRFSWDIAAPVIMTTRAGKNRNIAAVTVILTVVKLPTSENPRGIAIDSWVSR